MKGREEHNALGAIVEVEGFTVLPHSWSSRVRGSSDVGKEGRNERGQKMKTGKVVVQERGDMMCSRRRVDKTMREQSPKRVSRFIPVRIVKKLEPNRIRPVPSSQTELPLQRAWAQVQSH